MEINFSIRVENADARTVVDVAKAVEDSGFGGVSFADELMDLERGGGHSHDPWTLLAAVAQATERITLGSMVLNIANRDPGTTAVAAATMQQLATGRFWLGFGAGTNNGEYFSRDQTEFGRPPEPANSRRAASRAYLAELRRIWAHENFLRPDPVPPVFFGAFGPLSARLAGGHADGIACPVDGFGEHARRIEDLVAIAGQARAERGLDGPVRIIAHTGPHDDWDDPRWRAGAAVYDRLAELGAERLVLFIPAEREAVRKACGYLPTG
ncbi:LLM class flavin-dependent oxidoreductase [Sciscionella marina]|uniref:LLM class flavin-dependent oxidoreductase n=1 Tax=Sciscionella marina TaxID=508770 RepID=UPI00036050BC|nr:LLM class flavin-dependent oxidoreductase [Sciscionella marina]